MLRSLASRRLFAAKAPVRVAVTGGSGQIAYSLLFRIASGAFLGPSQPVILHVHDLPHMQENLRGVLMELQDCSFPLLKGTVASDDMTTVMQEVDYAFLVGAKPRGPGMERGDLLKQNGEIFIKVGQALNTVAKKTVRVLTVGNPVNTNALICLHYAPTIPKANFTAMTRLDHNRALAQLAAKTHCHVTDIKRLAIWGNHSGTMYPDVSNATIKGRPANEILNSDWISNQFIPTVANRGAAIIQARKLSSAASAASAAVDHMRDWVLGSHGEWVSMAVHSDQFNEEYGIPKGLIFSYPVICDEGSYRLVRDLEIDPNEAERLKKTTDELLGERKAVEHLLK